MSARKRTLATLLWLGVCASCSEPAEVAVATSCIYGGAFEPSRVELTAEERRAVVAVHDPVLNSLCSAVVVAEGAALTAKHCLSAARSSFQDVELLFGPDAYTSKLVRHPTSVGIHPSLDAALLHFDAAFAGDWQGTPVPLYPAIIDPSLVGAPVEIAGFGRAEDSEGRLKFAEQEVVAVNSTMITVGTESGTGACSGDSGGPMFIGTTAGAAVLGILDQGPSHCRGGDRYVRADLLHDLAGSGGCRP